ncbi:MAG: phosphate starvation-inducible protein PhoH [Gammaproteobacteria bacterium]|nr:phosphate starvation-inducible protein PhoH [Gammaproteobacteria bacterium]|tara:strand:- start:285 stop:1250 length:966 start_codon:yes stop_codon:yes gene_type:complete
MSKDFSSTNIELNPNDANVLIRFVGQLNENLKLVEKTFKVKIFQNGNKISISGNEASIKKASNAIKDLYASTSKGIELSKENIQMLINDNDTFISTLDSNMKENIIKTPKKNIKARGANQNRYLINMNEFDINFGIGPAGTGKTYLAVAKAVEMLINEDVKKIVLIRPAVEAGEKLGFLPGDLSQKVDPYLRPLYDALYDMLGFEQVIRLIEKEILEVAPLAYLRGRTLNNAFIIMDESQNTSVDQMKMFLTRMGFGSYAVVNGDVTQIDLPKNIESGLAHASKVLEGMEEIGFTIFNSKDVVRHPLVRKIVDAYDEYNKK